VHRSSLISGGNDCASRLSSGRAFLLLRAGGLGIERGIECRNLSFQRF